MIVKVVFYGFDIASHASDSDKNLFRVKLSNDIFNDLFVNYGIKPRERQIELEQVPNVPLRIGIILFKIENYQLIQTKFIEIKSVVVKNIKDVFKLEVNQNIIDISVDLTNETAIKKRNSGNPGAPSPENNVMNEESVEFRAKQYQAKEPRWTFEQLILPQSVLDELRISLNVLKYESKVFDQWGLRKIEPFPRSALNFYGPPGTGKTMAAHAIANMLAKKIFVASYAEIESKYHGEGPKNVEAIFYAAQRDDAVLFIDEADSLLSKRLLNVTQGSEQAINSMRSQLLICLEKFSGIVIFATNLVKNYDHAFETRVKNVQFVLPDIECRQKIWDVHLLSTIPKSPDVNSTELAEKFDGFCGRDIKNAVVAACVKAALEEREFITQQDLMDECNKIIQRRDELANAKDNTSMDQSVNSAQEQLRQVAEARLKALNKPEQTLALSQ